MIVLVLAAASMTPFRVAASIGTIEIVGFAIGMVNRGAPLASVPPEQVQRSELGGMAIGSAVGVIAIIVLARLLRESLATQAEALTA